MFKAIGAICAWGLVGGVVIAAAIGINVAIILGIVWVVKTVLF